MFIHGRTGIGDAAIFPWHAQSILQRDRIVWASKHVLPAASACNLKKYMPWKGLKKAMSAILATLRSIVVMKTVFFGQLLRVFTARVLCVSVDDKK
jgi:hypothetical protein